MFASDPIATSSKFKTYLDIEDGEFVELNRIYDTIEVNVYDSQLDKVDVSSRYLRMSVDTEDTKLQAFPNYMWKEMYEIPKAIRAVCNLELNETKKAILQKPITLTGCGSAYYVSEMGLYLRQMTDPTNLTYCVQADEIENKTSLESIDTLFCISQLRDI